MEEVRKKKIDKKVAIITGAGLIIGLGEALLYYNLGKNANSGTFQLGIPRGKELLQTTAVVIVTSILTAVLSKQIEKAVEGKRDQSLQV